jgi:hypothetical protein
MHTSTMLSWAGAVLAVVALGGCSGGGGHQAGDNEAQVAQTTGTLRDALQRQDAAAASALFVDSAQAGYQQCFQASPQQMGILSGALGTLHVESVESGNFKDGVTDIAVATVQFEGASYHARLLKVNGVWKFEAL